MQTKSALFGPASRVDFVAKFVASGADIGVLDLEDATPENAKATARAAVRAEVFGDFDLGDMTLLVRTNTIGSSHFADDLDAATEGGAHGIIVPKLEADREVDDVRDAMRSAGMENGLLGGGVESVAGVHRGVEICGAGLDLVYFGAEDFITDMGGVRSESNLEVLHARSSIVVAARLAGIPALDQVVVDYGDHDRFRSEAEFARSLGFSGKMCIHPSQVSLANEAFTPNESEIERARAIVAAAAAAALAGEGVVSFEGTMVDTPIVDRARALIADAEAAS